MLSLFFRRSRVVAYAWPAATALVLAASVAAVAAYAVPRALLVLPLVLGLVVVALRPGGVQAWFPAARSR